MNAPLTAPDCDLRDFPYMPLDVNRLRDSDLATDETPEACWAAVLIWCASWHQVPAGSIPDSNQWQAKIAGYVSRGSIDRGWSKVKSGALRGWILCSDGRLYHPVVAEKANDAWLSKLEGRWRKECDRIRKSNQRNDTQVKTPSFEEFLSQIPASSVPPAVPTMSHGKSGDVTRDNEAMSHGHAIDVTQMSRSFEQQENRTEQNLIPPNPQRGKSSAIGIKSFLDRCKASGEKPIPPDTAVIRYAQEVGLPEEFLRLAWREFVDRHRESDKRYRDWRKAFLNCVRSNWYRLWWATADGSYELTTVGVQAQRKHTENSAA